MATVDPATVSLWTGRIVPVFLIAIVGTATYVHVVRLCIYVILPTNPQVAIALLVVYFILFFPMSICYIRLLLVLLFDPGYVPQGPSSQRRPKSKFERGRRARREAYSQQYESTTATSPRNDADSPGLENFYTKDIFVSDVDGKPLWCAECANWKPDRAHHCSDVGRCVRKMDHFCPWAGGVVGETSFKFFIQFVAYTAIYCAFLVGVMAYYLSAQASKGDVDPIFAAVVGFAGFFGLFSGGMMFSSAFLAVANLTTIENLRKATYRWRLAVLIPDRPISSTSTETPFEVDNNLVKVTYPLPLPPPPAQNGHGDETRNAETLTERDAKAKRSFVVLDMDAHRNPWDIGMMGNWKSVMGNSVIDWFLPIKHSPCRNHEDPESQFPAGRWVERLKVHHGLMTDSEKRKPQPFSSGRAPRRRRRDGVEMGQASRSSNTSNGPTS